MSSFLSFPEASTLFPFNFVILVGWMSLWFSPLSPSTRYAVLFPALALSLCYTAILIRHLLHPTDPTANVFTFFFGFFTFSGWVNRVKDAYTVIGITNHFCVMDIWCGQWMVQDFYTRFTCGWTQPPKIDGTGGILGWTVDRITFTVILIITFMVAPFGFLCYQFMRTVRYSQFPSEAALRLAEKQQ